MALGEESPIFSRTYDLLLWLSGRVSHFPKDQRFRLAQLHGFSLRQGFSIG